MGPGPGLVWARGAGRGHSHVAAHGKALPTCFSLKSPDACRGGRARMRDTTLLVLLMADAWTHLFTTHTSILETPGNNSSHRHGLTPSPSSLQPPTGKDDPPQPCSDVSENGAQVSSTVCVSTCKLPVGPTFDGHVCTRPRVTERQRLP